MMCKREEEREGENERGKHWNFYQFSLHKFHHLSHSTVFSKDHKLGKDNFCSLISLKIRLEIELRIDELVLIEDF